MGGLAIRNTPKLAPAQLRDMQRLYRFAELGQLSTALFHDLANHLSVLVLDLENLPQSAEYSLQRAFDSITYIDKLVAEVRRQLRQDERPRHIGVLHQIQEVAANLQPRFTRAGVRFDVEVGPGAAAAGIFGDPTRFAQVMTVLMINALEAAAPGRTPTRRRVLVTVDCTPATVSILVQDWGGGVPPAARHKIFRLFYGTKPGGMGIGLFITKQIIETHFKGSIRLVSPCQPTTFKLVLPTVKASKPAVSPG